MYILNLPLTAIPLPPRQLSFKRSICSPIAGKVYKSFQIPIMKESTFEKEKKKRIFLLLLSSATPKNYRLLARVWLIHFPFFRDFLLVAV